MNKAYAAALRMGKGQHVNVLERAKAAAEDYLAHFPPERRGAILLGALASVYGKEEGGSDTARPERSDGAVWLAGDKDKSSISRTGIGEASIAHETIVALQEIGLLDELVLTKEGLIVYPAVLDSEHVESGKVVGKRQR
ncbi:MAG: hypothetical protein KF770_25700 [Anaerolineae bacterium]|nr:hypothetical protein [Anaerolineae bacterium]